MLIRHIVHNIIEASSVSPNWMHDFVLMNYSHTRLSMENYYGHYLVLWHHNGKTGKGGWNISSTAQNALWHVTYFFYIKMFKWTDPIHCFSWQDIITRCTFYSAPLSRLISVEYKWEVKYTEQNYKRNTFLDLWVQLMKNGGKNKSVAFIILLSVWRSWKEWFPFISLNII